MAPFAASSAANRPAKQNGEAKTVAAVWESAQFWDGPVAQVQEPETAVPASGRISTTDAIAAFLSIRQGSKIAPSTIRKYVTFCNQLRAFADDKGYVLLDQFTAADILGRIAAEV